MTDGTLRNDPDAPVLPDVEELLGAQVVSEETSPTVASLAARLIKQDNPLKPGSAYYAQIIKIMGADGQTLDMIEEVAVLLEPLFADIRSVAASALTQAPDHG